MKQDVIQQASEITVSYKPAVEASKRLRICNSTEAESVLRTVWELPIDLRESFYALYLDRANKLLGYLLVSIGGVTGTVVDPRIIFQTALKANACSLILAHNHPSGNPEPSRNDLLLTGKLKDAGKLLEIQVLDHLILLPGGYHSMADAGEI